MNFLKNFSVPDFIQICIFIALLWYSWETSQLRKWQKKQAQLTVLGLDMQRIRNHHDTGSNPTPYGEEISVIVRKIYELGKFDAKVLYANKEPLTFFGKKMKKVKNFIKNKKSH